MANIGTDSVFAMFPASILPKGQEAAIGGEIEDLLAETLEHEKLGIVLGGALGTRLAYIDLIFFMDPRLKAAAATIASHALRSKAEFYHLAGLRRMK